MPSAREFCYYWGTARGGLAQASRCMSAQHTHTHSPQPQVCPRPGGYPVPSQQTVSSCRLSHQPNKTRKGPSSRWRVCWIWGLHTDALLEVWVFPRGSRLQASFIRNVSSVTGSSACWKQSRAQIMTAVWGKWGRAGIIRTVMVFIRRLHYPEYTGIHELQ